MSFPLPSDATLQNTLFLTDLDGTLLHSKQTLSPYSENQLIKLLQKRLLFSAVTARTPATLLLILQNLPLTLPVGCMNGAAFYDLKQRKYIDHQTMPYPVAQQIIQIFEEENAELFVHTITSDGWMEIFHPSLHTPSVLSFYHSRLHLPLKRYIESPLPAERPCVYCTALGEKDKIEKVYRRLCKSSIRAQVRSCFYRDIYQKDVYFLELYAKTASKKQALQWLKDRTNAQYTVAFGDNENDLNMLQMADLGLAVENATLNCKQAADFIIEANDSDSVVRAITEITNCLSHERREKR